MISIINSCMFLTIIVAFTTLTSVKEIYGDPADLPAAHMVEQASNVKTGERWLKCINFLMKVFTGKDDVFKDVYGPNKQQLNPNEVVQKYGTEIETLEYITKRISQAQKNYGKSMCEDRKLWKGVGTESECVNCNAEIYNELYGSGYWRKVQKSGVVGYKHDKKWNKRCKKYQFLRFRVCEALLATFRRIYCEVFKYNKHLTTMVEKYVNSRDPDCCEAKRWGLVFDVDIIQNACHFGNVTKIEKCYTDGKKILDYIRERDHEKVCH